MLIAPYGGGYKDAIDSAHAEQVVDVHDQRILGDALPYGEVSRLAPVEVGQRGLGACAVGVHDVAVLGVTAEDVGDDLAEGLRVESLVYVLDGGMDVLLAGGDAALHIAFVHIRCVVTRQPLSQTKDIAFLWDVVAILIVELV